ncbi:oxygenase MpaB family protein [Candidatus Binatia bacterium]|jgi:uncharacterized protein (DUF2236 family)|nr:oxygenase MpaB family protein [Candidatus Binatia bacterium]
MIPESYLGWKIDFSTPRGEHALLPPDSVHWRIYKNPVALGIGGVAAVLLEFADARIRSGVWDHSTYKADPIGRSQRTGIAALVGVYGPASAARKVIGGVNRMHAQVKGTTPAGEAYTALDPELLDWVAATAEYGFLTAYDRFVAPVSDEDATRFYEEGAVLSRLYGVKQGPRSPQDFLDMLEQRAPRFEPHPIVDEFVEIIQSGRAAPVLPGFLHRALARASISLLPTPVRQRLGFGPEHDLGRTDRIALKMAGRVAERFSTDDAPHRQACLRLGLPADFLHRSAATQRRMLEASGLAGAAAPPVVDATAA